MGIVLLMARLFLASILVIAGVAKAVDPAGARKALIGFGVSDKLSAPLGWFLPILEIVVAVALIPLNTAWIGALAALALMLAFSAAIGINLLRGRTPECNCFGQLHSKPVSWSMFSRNLMLAAVAALVVAQGKQAPGVSMLNWLAELKTGEMMNLLVSSVAVGLLVAGVAYLRRVLNQQMRILDRIDAVEKLVEEYAPPPVEREEATPPPEGLPVGAPAPDFSLASVGGGQISLRDLVGYGKPVLLLFVSPNCAPCATILRDVRAWERDYADKLTIALLSKGSLPENEKRLTKYGAKLVLLAEDSDVAEAYQTRWTPAAVLISDNGRIASHNAYGDESIRALITAAPASTDIKPNGNGAVGAGHRLQVPVGYSAFKVGDPAPSFSMHDLFGEGIKTEDFLGSDTLLIFWDPECPFCQGMSEDLRVWEETPPTDAPQLVFVVSGDVERVKAASEKFKSRFLHDSELRVGHLFGTRSTPAAVLIDREGRIASSIATGSPNVLALAGVRKPAMPVVSSSS